MHLVFLVAKILVWLIALASCYMIATAKNTDIKDGFIMVFFFACFIILWL